MNEFSPWTRKNPRRIFEELKPFYAEDETWLWSSGDPHVQGWHGKVSNSPCSCAHQAEGTLRAFKKLEIVPIQRELDWNYQWTYITVPENPILEYGRMYVNNDAFWIKQLVANASSSGTLYPLIIIREFF
ncbi:hypothetical protein NC653_018159 [Populus alba x Populus x berolinensis]|uniref:Uncharacterized protein n=1 Tax=Populus alba x Populus x berolinensis TaxID=444605 RepID=A0AAD6VUG6_9ROSI|nr:hypothetical protein NC653_018159 [Populus alba x Populus x berolinensis]